MCVKCSYTKPQCCIPWDLATARARPSQFTHPYMLCVLFLCIQTFSKTQSCKLNDPFSLIFGLFGGGGVVIYRLALTERWVQTVFLTSTTNRPTTIQTYLIYIIYIYNINIYDIYIYSNCHLHQLFTLNIYPKSFSILNSSKKKKTKPRKIIWQPFQGKKILSWGTECTIIIFFNWRVYW